MAIETVIPFKQKKFKAKKFSFLFEIDPIQLDAIPVSIESELFKKNFFVRCLRSEIKIGGFELCIYFNALCSRPWKLLNLQQNFCLHSDVNLARYDFSVRFLQDLLFLPESFKIYIFHDCLARFLQDMLFFSPRVPQHSTV